MGAWGFGIFENDTACDFAAAVSDGGGMPLLEQALDRVLACGDNYLEAPEAEECLAAAEIIARMTGSSWHETTSTTSVEIRGAHISVSGDFTDKAKRAIARVLSEPSEIVELWTESDDFDGWKQSVEELLARL
ncbi:DUF4259 domain-containing protein [Terriglobus albidus]|uniref:DUF4259 domain-containing protein n=1 Tax=Terriglobus albidus TaxID=1592106 RepID=A0A5B9EAJ5_9BACT|nr:DUF4259 domain-containing protein [Terriglobus albidus]QEE27441.1 DUF4259 domain-containing protein [Terriglobus albidus]